MVHMDKLSGITPEEIRSIRERLGLTQVEAGELLGGGPRAFTKYEAGTVKPAASVINLLRVLDAHPDSIATLGGHRSPRTSVHGPLPFEVGGDDIKSLTQESLPEILRRLLHAEALANDLPEYAIHVAGDVHTADGGEDGRIEWHGGPDNTRFLPARLCQFQAKAGGIAPVEAALEVLKPMVRSVLETGGRYIMICGHRYARQSLERRQDRMRQALRDAGVTIEDSQVDVRDADQIAAWANHHPGVAMAIKERTQPGTIGPFRPWSHWAGRPEHECSPWVEDERLTELSTWLHGRVTTERGVARLVGPWAIGKSRLTLEALGAGGSSLSPIVMYAVQSEFGAHEINRIVQNLAATGNRAVVVVDECPLDEHRALARMVSREGSRLSLITLDDELPPGVTDDTTFAVSNALPSVTEAIVTHTSPSLSFVDKQRLVHFCNGFPRLAIRIADSWDSLPLANATDTDLVDAFVLGRSPRERDLRLRSTQLLAAYGPVRFEPSSDCKLREMAPMGRHVTVQDLRFSAHQLLTLGAAQRRGGYVVIQPHPISLNLAERQWSEWSPETWDEVLTGSTSAELKASAARQLALLNDTKIAQRVAIHVSRVAGPLDTQGIAQPGHLEVLSSLAQIDPVSIIAQIQRSLDVIDPSELHIYVRPTLIRALSMIAFDSSTFYVGARLLLRLATAEERIASCMPHRLRRIYRGGLSGAAIAFASLFPVLLGSTAADGPARLSLLDEAIHSNDSIQRSIVVNALIQGLDPSHPSRQVGPEIRGSSPASTEWHPPTEQQRRHYVEGCMTRLGELARSRDPAGATARAAIAQAASGLIAAGYIDTVETVIHQMAELAHPWTGALNALGVILQRDATTLDTDTVARLRKLLTELQPKALLDRVRAQVTTGTWDHSFNGGQFLETMKHHERRAEAVRELAPEVLRQPGSLETLLPELSCGRQSMAYEFGKAVAERDNPLNWLEPIAVATEKSTDGERNYDLLTGYLTGVFATQPDEVVAFKRRASKSPELAPSLPLLCRRIGVVTDDLELVTQALRGGLLPPRHLKEWRIQGSMDEIPETAIAPFVEVLIDNGADAFAIAVELADRYIEDDPQRLDRLWPQIRSVAKNATRWTSVYGDIAVYHFERLMSRILQKGRHDSIASALAVDLSKALVNADQYDAMRMIEPVIPTLLSDYPEIAWPLIGHAIISDDKMASLLSYILGRSPFDPKNAARILCLPLDAMFAWCYAHADRAPAFVARVLPLLATSSENSAPCLHPALERLLVEFGNRDDVQQAIIDNIEALGWVGSMTSRYAQFEIPLRALESHRLPLVRDWAMRMLRYLDDRKQEATYLDEEREVQAELSS